MGLAGKQEERVFRQQWGKGHLENLPEDERAIVNECVEM
jgi:hypothetical protein